MAGQHGTKGGNGKGQSAPDAARPRRGRGFTPAGGFLAARLREVSGKRGIAETRLLTDWEAVAGPEIAALCRPVKVTHARKGGLGATLILLTSSGRAPELEMLRPVIRERVNACYGYHAIAEIRLTQTAPTGFAEPGGSFTHRPAGQAAPRPLPEQVVTRVQSEVRDVSDDGLRAALERLGRNVAVRQAKTTEKKGPTR
ncbi:DUF721 domain-containing protein [Oceanicella sp. SM1341]|uniref:DUF721 domain-containing protein n=1 Tax=Oceanicella sp. SM1341 TaxID=1548889 RepID=UPI000E5332FE|nr:DUF721 domain-containing protein [Oceanicella sp. SM1341]